MPGKTIGGTRGAPAFTYYPPHVQGSAARAYYVVLMQSSTIMRHGSLYRNQCINLINAMPQDWAVHPVCPIGPERRSFVVDTFELDGGIGRQVGCDLAVGEILISGT
jgi:hypothetical protein